MGERVTGRGFPWAFLGYGFLYAWGYLSWNTDALATRSVTGATLDPSWVVSAFVVPLALVVLAVLGRRLDFEHMHALHVAAPVIAALGSVLSVVYQHVSHAGLAMALAVASGVGTGVGSALFGLLWSLALSRLNMATLEVVLPVSFVVSVACTLVAPSLAHVSALAMALLLVALCGLSLLHVRSMLDDGDGLGERWREEGDQAAPGIGAMPASSVVTGVSGVEIARMLAFGVVAWSVMNVVPMAGIPHGLEGGEGGLLDGVDVQGLLGLLFAIGYALAIIRFAVRVDFQALAPMTLPPLVLSMTLFATGNPTAVFWAGVLNVGLNSCCEIILLLYFVRIAQGRPGRRAFWLGMGSAASYLGVLLGQLGSALFVRGSVAEGELAWFCLVVVCVYSCAMLLIPQRVLPMTATPASALLGLEGSARSMATGAANGGRGGEAGRGVRDGEAGIGAATGADAGRAGGASGEAGSAVDGDLGVAQPDAIARACARVAAEYGLSTREAEVCEYLARGRSQVYIRDALLLSKNTVATHTRRLYAKLGVHSKQELIDLVERHR